MDRGGFLLGGLTCQLAHDSIAGPACMCDLHLMFSLALLVVAAPQSSCDLSLSTSAREVHNAFALRAVEVMSIAAAGGPKNESRLATLIDPSAIFLLGAGDVGQSLGSGVSGAIAMAKRTNADQYRFLGWDYMDGPANGCSKGEIEVEFIDSAQSAVSQIKFVFDNGRVVAATGWQRSFQTGPLAHSAGR